MRTTKVRMAACTVSALAVATAIHVGVATQSDERRAAVAMVGDVEPGVDMATIASSAPILVRAADPAAPRADGGLFEISPGGEVSRVAGMDCKRVAASPSGEGICLRVSRNGLDYEGVVFGAGYRRAGRFPVQGVPDRARVSDDGRYAAYTSFDAAQSYGYFANREFDTYTRIVAMETGEVLHRLEDLRIVDLAGRPVVFEGGDTDLWGATFGDDGRFYATVAGRTTVDSRTDLRHFLIAGRVGARTARVVSAGVECPALSPDGRRIAYKRRVDRWGQPNRWRLHVMTLTDDGRRAPGRDVVLAERRSIDDQPEWLDDERILYSDDRSVSVVRADGRGSPKRIASRATSPISLAPHGPAAR